MTPRLCRRVTTCLKKKKKGTLFFRALIQLICNLLFDTRRCPKPSRPLIHISVTATQSHIAVCKTWQAQGRSTKINTSSFPDNYCLSDKYKCLSGRKTSKAALSLALSLSLHQVPLDCVVPRPDVAKCLNSPTLHWVVLPTMCTRF